MPTRAVTPARPTSREFAKRVARLAGSGVPVFLLVGNHDTPHVLGRATSLEIFQTLDVSNVHIGDTLRTYRIETADGPAQIVAVPWVRRSAFLSQDDTRGLSPDQVNEAIQERLARAIQLQADNLDASVPAIFAGHVTVSDATTGSERTMMLGRDYVLVRSSVALPQFDYVALGHIHKHQILGSSPLVVYSGSLQRVDFGEESDEKGFCVVELDPREKPGSRLKQHQFQTVHSRTFRTVSVDIRTGDPDPTATVLKAIAATDIRDAVVRLQISVPRGAGRAPARRRYQSGTRRRPLRRRRVERGEGPAAQPAGSGILQGDRSQGGAETLLRGGRHAP